MSLDRENPRLCQDMVLVVRAGSGRWWGARGAAPRQGAWGAAPVLLRAVLGKRTSQPIFGEMGVSLSISRWWGGRNEERFWQRGQTRSIPGGGRPLRLHGLLFCGETKLRIF